MAKSSRWVWTKKKIVILSGIIALTTIATITPTIATIVSNQNAKTTSNYFSLVSDQDFIISFSQNKETINSLIIPKSDLPKLNVNPKTSDGSQQVLLYFNKLVLNPNVTKNSSIVANSMTINFVVQDSQNNQLSLAFTINNPAITLTQGSKIEIDGLSISAKLTSDIKNNVIIYSNDGTTWFKGFKVQ